MMLGSGPEIKHFMGRNAFEGPGSELLADPDVVALYLGSGAGRSGPPPV